MGTLTRATRNITRRKTRTLLVIIALSLALAMIISIPPSINASQEATQKTIDKLTTTAKIVNSTVNLAATEIDCKLPLTLRTDAGPYHNETVFEQPLMNYNRLRQPHLRSKCGTHYTEYLEHSSRQLAILQSMVYPVDDATLLSNYPILLPANITAGRNLQAGDSGVVVLHERIANHFDVTVGGTITIFGRDFKVVGIEGQEATNYNLCHHEYI